MAPAFARSRGPVPPRVSAVEAVVRGVAQPEPRVVDNSWYAHTVLCVVPEPTAGSALETDGSVRISVSLNGQQFTHEDVRFSIHRSVEGG